MERRVLFTSAIQPIGGCSPDVYSWNKSIGPVKVLMTFLDHPGLAFLEANLPGVDALPYPTWDDFREALRDPPEILGISFYINETELALQMAELARRRGVREVWAGNYGAYSPEVEHAFDRVFQGWGESEAARALGVSAPEPLVHPPMYACMGSNLLPRLSLHGFLFTSRGCPCTCNFCQTPDFYGKSQPVPLDAIDRVLWEYARQGIATVNVLDENFGIFPAHTREVIRLFRAHRLRWVPLCRVDLLLKNLEEWVEHGLTGAHIGVESLNPRSLEGAQKKIDQLKSVELLRRMSRYNLLVQAFYIIGFEEDTAESVREDICRLADLDVDLAQIQILTPYPKTPLRDKIEEGYGIFDRDLSNYNSRNLVWNHPSISPREMLDLQRWAHRHLFTPRRALRTLSKALVYDGRTRPTFAGVGRSLRSMRPSPLRRKLSRGLRSSRRWARRGWDAYEQSMELPGDRGFARGVAPGQTAHLRPGIDSRAM